ncbi:MAG: hypothetical protein KBE65_05175 [Phycisphaerae bacterium]|nr:hypothetical protein [Phycisphaerae bacterium]
MNTGSIKMRLRPCRRCEYLCTDCPHALHCAVQGQRVRPTECYICWHNEGTLLPKDCRVRNRNPAPAARADRSSRAKRF